MMLMNIKIYNLNNSGCYYSTLVEFDSGLCVFMTMYHVVYGLVIFPISNIVLGYGA